MKPRNTSKHTISIFALLTTTMGCLDPQESPQPSPAQAIPSKTLSQTLKFSEDELQVPLSPPYIGQIYTCGTLVSASGVVDGATAELYVNGALVAQATPDPSSHVTFQTPPLQEGQNLTTRQVLNGQASPTSPPRPVLPPATSLPKPIAAYDIWKCGKRVTAKGTRQNLLVRAHQNGNIIAQGEATDRWHDKMPLNVPPLGPNGDAVSFDLVSCPGTPDEVIGPMSTNAYIALADEPVAPPTTARAYPAENRFYIEGLHVGATYEFFNTITGSLFTHYVTGFEEVNLFTPPFNATDTFEVASSLCEKPDVFIPVEIVPEDVTEIELNHTRLAGPICPSTRTLNVYSTVATGTIIIFLNGNPIQQQAVAGHNTTVNLLNTVALSDGDILGVRHVLMSNGVVHLFGELSTTVVDSSESKLTILGAQHYEDQLTGEPIIGFIRNGEKMNTGPEIELACCAACDCSDCADAGYQCLVKGEPRSAAAEISLNGNTVATIDLVEEEFGKFRGHWNWLEDPPSNVPPEDLFASHEYKVTVTQSPCGNKGSLEEYFTVLLGKPHHSSYPPEYIDLQVSDRFGNAVGVKNGQSDANLTVSASTNLDIQVVGIDSLNGLRKLEIFSSNGGLSETLVEAQQIPPIPSTLSLRPYLSCLPFGASTDIYAVAENWHGDTLSTPVITVTGGAPNHYAPSISSVTPSSPDVDDVIRIRGDHLIYESQQCLSYTTQIVFTSPAAPTETLSLGDTYTPLQTSPREIKEIPFPSSWQNMNLEGEEVCVQVKVIGNTTKTSNTKCFTIKEPCQPSGVIPVRLDKVTDRGNDMLLYRGNFLRSSFIGCNPYKHVKVVAVENPAGMNYGCPLEVGAYLYEPSLNTYVYLPFSTGIPSGQTHQGIYGPFYQGVDHAYWEARVYAAQCTDWYKIERATLNLHWVEE
ncbi:hypothetical protein [Lujinxingia litoralis]|uniref:hypothetical protein n=1 Tax=Lujinxingia litoralis TaxID=2211119 RepID=UPI0011B938D3|nr:hypothetical protein [Lujinxingia litoralis]